jgi:uncharacterized damage-inducible protein DinB
MNISISALRILDQLRNVVESIESNDFCAPSEALSGSTIGQHLRHTLEFFICFENGFKNGILNYDKRAHDKLIESDKYLALSTIESIKDFVKNIDLNKNLQLEVSYDITSDSFAVVDTNALRELVYNIEHAVHHMAIMKIGIREVAPYLKLSSDFGVAASTVRFQQQAEYKYKN